MKHYQYKSNGNDQYIVIKRWMEGDKERYKEYYVSFKNGDMMCDCPGFMRWSKKCKHIRFILSQLAAGGGIIDFNRN